METLIPLQSRLEKFFLERLHIEIPSVDTDLLEVGALDSLAFVELLHYVEEEFQITVPLDDLEVDDFRSIEKIAKYVATRNGGNSALEAVKKVGEGRT
jgi:methoxymalonate biosynthesis acyl carrier protein